MNAVAVDSAYLERARAVARANHATERPSIAYYRCFVCRDVIDRVEYRAREWVLCRECCERAGIQIVRAFQR